MSYGSYVMAAYAVFIVVLAWDWLQPRLELRRELRRAAQRAERSRDASRARP